MEAAGSPWKKMKSARIEPLEAGNPAAEGDGPAEDQEPPLTRADGGSPSKKRKSTRIEPLEAAAEGGAPGSAAEDQEPPNEMEDVGSPSKKWKPARIEPLEAENSAAAAAEGGGSGSAAENQEPPLPGTDGGATEDRISQLPVALLQSIISLLPTKDGACTQVLASAWRHLWRSAPLNLDHDGLCQDPRNLRAIVLGILSAHQGPCRRFCAPVYHLHGDRVVTVDAWLQYPALRDLQELELSTTLWLSDEFPMPSPAAAFRFSETLCVATIGDCQFPDIPVRALKFPKLKMLVLERVSISESSLHNMFAGCLALECLLIMNSYGFRCLRINSISLRSIGYQIGGYPFRQHLRFEELIIQNAPCLERLLRLRSRGVHTSVISAPKLETIGCLSSDCTTRLTFRSTVIQGLHVDSPTSEVCTVKILSVDMCSLDAIIKLMMCFPCLERLYIESVDTGETNVWFRRRRVLLESLDIRLKRISWRFYRGSKSHVNFARFFVINAKVLELMTFQVSVDYDVESIAQQSKVLKLDSKASRGAQFRFTPDDSHRNARDFRVHDLDLADPFERKDHSRFIDLS
ncbi:unnamed protein product [Alopecurus aequalis]